MSSFTIRERFLSVVSRIAEFHRAIFVMATAGVAISGSRVASEPGDLSSWLFVVGFSLGLFSADLLRSVEEAAVQLARSSATRLSLTRIDFFKSSDPWRTVLVGVVGLLMIVLGTLTLLS